MLLAGEGVNREGELVGDLDLCVPGRPGTLRLRKDNHDAMSGFAGVRWISRVASRAGICERARLSMGRLRGAGRRRTIMTRTNGMQLAFSQDPSALQDVRA